MRPSIGLSTFIWCFIAGMCWSFGTITQYSAYPEIGVSMTMPTSTGSQLVGTSIVGVLFFGSWATLPAKLIGFLAI
ncbi:MAG: ribose uptake protein RbsU [Acetilactobacillus jinshanensis]